MLKPSHIAETSLYVDDLERAAGFYMRLFDAEAVHHDQRLCALRITADQVLLLFKRGASTAPGGNDGAGPLHVCFAIRAAELASWEERLKELNISIESRVQGPTGATSLYFRDPDNHAVELATLGL